MMSASPRLDEFFARAIPVAHVLDARRGTGTMWWVFRGAIIRVHMDGEELTTDLVEPDTPWMDELITAAGSDAVLDGVLTAALFG
jgi:hypothetical protein